ncbi:hypothetical protein [Nocardiopsis coralliicola]
MTEQSGKSADEAVLAWALARAVSDVNMLVNVGGRERTRSDFARLCARAGFSLASTEPLANPSCYRLLEAVPV